MQQRQQMDTAIETVVLDLGQVVVDWDPLRHPTLPRDEVAAIATTIGFHAINLRADAGERWDDLAAEVAHAFPDRPELAAFVAEYPDRFPGTLTGPVPGTAEVVVELHAAGVRLLGLTNWSAETYPHGIGAAPAIGLLEDVLVSGRVRLIKPDPAIFRLLVDRYRLVPERTLFVDDNPANVAAARDVGLLGHTFVGADALRAELERLGLLPADPSERRRGTETATLSGPGARSGPPA